MENNDKPVTLRSSHIRPRLLKSRRTAKDIQRESRLEQIEINLCRALHYAGEYIFHYPPKELATLAIELAKLRESKDPFKELEDAAQLWTKASEAIAYERDARPRMEREAREKEAMEYIHQSLSYEHPHKKGVQITPDTPVEYALFVSDGTNLDGVEPPCNLSNGKKPPVPLYKTESKFLDLLRHVAKEQLTKPNRPAVSKDIIEEKARNMLHNAKKGYVSVGHYEQILYFFERRQGDRTKAAREARAANRAKTTHSEPEPQMNQNGAMQKPVKVNRSKKSLSQTPSQKTRQHPTE